MLLGLLSRQKLLPNEDCSMSFSSACLRLGPFFVPAAVNGTVFQGRKVSVRDIRCSDDDVEHINHSLHRVTAVVRAVVPSRQEMEWLRDRASSKELLDDGLTLAAEGTWDSISGELCMVGCRGGRRQGLVACGTRIRVTIPLSLSLKQTMVVRGSIASTNSPPEFYPLAFQLPMGDVNMPPEFHQHATYDYSRLTEAASLMEKYEVVASNSSFFGVAHHIIRKWRGFLQLLLQYPSANGNKSGDTIDLFRLSENLSLRAFWAMPNPYGAVLVTLDVTAIQDRIVSRYHHQVTYKSDNGEAAGNVDVDDKGDDPAAAGASLYKVAVQLLDPTPTYAVGHDHGGFPTHEFIAAEGWYDSASGQMFLLGCRHVNVAEMEVAAEVKEGLDRGVEIRVRYPPRNAMLLTKGTVKVTIASNRGSDDPLFFEDVELETVDTVSYRDYHADIDGKRTVQATISDIALSLSIVCLIGQLVYVKKNRDDVEDSAPRHDHISLLIVSLQAIVFCMPLISGAVMVAFPNATSIVHMTFSLVYNQRWRKAIAYMMVVHDIAGLFLTWMIVREVYKSKRRLRERSSLQARRRRWWRPWNFLSWGRYGIWSI
ncbi:hypothetical protein KP509_37G044500 [Ceratopteris richardii]|uniref:DUF2921 domain-containing protein n=1 Tax=Ceratopteris richardii TaxID=49495 RepID=A0A8T2Q7I1_CERRI|nr:hypothetical protein KP509_37G044500 [Ceratopteris richardii]